MNILAIDPGSTESAYVVIDVAGCRPVAFGKIDNLALLSMFGDAFVDNDYGQVAIEMIASYGMAVGAEVFQTVRWIGRFEQALTQQGHPVTLTYRREVKLHHCASAKAKDGNIVQALVDRFASGVPNHGKGSKADPGFFHGFRADIWQSFALAVQFADTHLVEVKS